MPAQAPPVVPPPPPASHVDLNKPEAAAGKPAEPKPAEVAAAAGERLGIVPSVVQRVAYPFYLVAVLVVLAMAVIDYVWFHHLRGTTGIGSQTLSHFVVATYGNHGVIQAPAELGIIAVVCFLLMPTRLLPRGWFRQRGVAKEFAKELKAEFGVDMLFKQQFYFQKLMLAFALWAIAIGFLVERLVKKGSFVLQTGGYLTLGALLVGFACSGVLAVRRTPVVGIDDAGRILHH